MSARTYRRQRTEPCGCQERGSRERVISTEALRREFEEQEEQQEACVAGAGAGGVSSSVRSERWFKAYGLALRARGEALTGCE